MRTKIYVIFIAVTFTVLPLWGAIQEPIRIDGGSITGTPAWGWGLRLYRGIPYAAPPVGDLRWRPPQAVKPWPGVLAADHFAPACMQAPREQTSVYWGDGLATTSEDCLYLNIWTPAKSANEKLPVMVWIHGGALLLGAASEPLFDGSMLAKKDVVVVTFNYRLNVFGFFAHPELTAESQHRSSGNYGMLDQVAALRWVKNNIAQFGGDPNSVTIFGQSGGSRSVSFHMASPLTEGLFQRAIAQSHTAFGRMPALAHAEAEGAKFAHAVSAPSLAALRKMTAQDLEAAAIKHQSELTDAGAIVDGWYLPNDIYTIFSAGKQNDVPLITGGTNDETGLAGLPEESQHDAAAYTAWAKKLFGEKADNFLKLYPAASNDSVGKAFHDATRDANLAGHRTWVELQSKTGKSKAYLYIFSCVLPRPNGPGLPPPMMGAVHSSDLFYSFNNLWMKDLPWTVSDQKVAEMMSSYWTNFAKTGDPNGPGLPHWPAYDFKNEQLLNIADTPRAEPIPDRDGLDFLAAIDEQRRETANVGR